MVDRRASVYQAVHPAALFARLDPHGTDRGPEAERAVADGDDGRAPPTACEVPQQRRPALGAFAIPVFDRNQFRRPVGSHTNHHERAEAIVVGDRPAASSPSSTGSAAEHLPSTSRADTRASAAASSAPRAAVPRPPSHAVPGSLATASRLRSAWVASPSPGGQPGCVLLNSHEGYAAFRHSGDPQHAVISPRRGGRAGTRPDMP
jgi:hypothetical protein